MLIARPYVVINVAASVDGKIDTLERRGAAISSERDRQRVDALRASVDAVMIGGHTLVDEDPRLTVKSVALRTARLARGEPENPAKVAIASAHLRLNPRGRFITAGPARIIVFTPTTVSNLGELTLREEGSDASGSSEATLRGGRSEASGSAEATLGEGRADVSDYAKATPREGIDDASQPTERTPREESAHALRREWAALRTAGAEIFALGEGRVDLVAALQKLGELGLRSVLVEGGGSLNFELLRLGLVDEVQVFVAPVIFGGMSAPTLADGAGLVRDAAIRMSRIDFEVWEDGGVLLRYKVEPRE